MKPLLRPFASSFNLTVKSLLKNAPQRTSLLALSFISFTTFTTPGAVAAGTAETGGICAGVNEYPNWTARNWFGGEYNHAKAGDQMVHNNTLYKANWYTRSVPGSDVSWTPLGACNAEDDTSGSGGDGPLAASCGYSVRTGIDAEWGQGYKAYAALENESGPSAYDFELFIDTHGSEIYSGWLGNFNQVDNGYIVNAPHWLKWRTILPGKNFRIGFLGAGENQGFDAYVTSVNGVQCDTANPSISLDVTDTFYTGESTLTLTATAEDNVALAKVVFTRNGEVIAELSEAPFEVEVAVTEALNGRNTFAATAYDISGNEKTADSSVLVAINNRFLGSTPGGLATYEHMGYFNQLTPENAGKWASVEATRDEMNWADMDYAYNYSREMDIPIKLHTLVWGQQAPNWIDNLPAAEQLEEVEEWYAALAARYPDAELIDVVNEPLHAPATYREALGGDGETGWDWVIKSFEMAREYFPNAELLLNDYNIIQLQSSTMDYLAIIELLQERGLIDGIGLQSHFLERADLNEVALNLDVLAATGLPIYISELDVNFADDARHANWLRDLVTIFLNNPSVVGITHWGHLQNTMWREDAYLINRDGSLRAGMEWLLCVYAGEQDCTVPEYIPGGWSGDANGLTLEAEIMDAQQGLAGGGNSVTYSDGGDWFAFYAVDFLSDWNTATVNYAKGSDTATTLTVHLDSLDSPPIASFDLVNTGGWGTAAEATIDWPAVTGEHDVYFLFNGSWGAGNIDFIRFGQPEQPSNELIQNGGFESGSTSGWFSWGASLSTTTDVVYEGSYALQVSDRTDSGPAAISLDGLVQAGGVYQLSMMATIMGSPEGAINVTRMLECSGEQSYAWIVNPVTIAEGQWVALSAEVEIPADCELTGLNIFAESSDTSFDFYLDNVSLTGTGPEGEVESVLPGGDFEDGTASSWFTWDGTLNVVADPVFEGTYALELSDRSGNGPAATNIASLVTPGTTYTASFAVTIAGAAEAPVNITLATQCVDEDASYAWVANTDAVQEGAWTVLSGNFDVPDCELEQLMIFAEGPAGGIDLYLDSVTIVEQ